ncbi:uncharacterized protein LOC124945764 isoform X1 [Impatiens glandulifera]|uniref:uncharacterized protein LOC124945764 isoform X1 n=2 Tax=Impatiens glandulifera TaxID=253017 RepID=UPI001FB07A41|nr:uncharacterized protein LOC124945764 isoform X1 [Impatiens glandulifera]
MLRLPTSPASARAVMLQCHTLFFARPQMGPPPTTFSPSAMSSSSREAHGLCENSSAITLHEWQGWGTHSQVPAMVEEIVDDLMTLQRDADARLTFGGLGGKLQGDLKVYEDKKHRAKYQSLSGSEQKLQFFSARQIACRLLGSRGYLCQKCWLSMEDCMCSRLIPSCSLWKGMRFWVYMHPKDFLRQNNTGKLLWQVFGSQDASLCLYGISEHEEIMWDAFKHAGRGNVCCLYPNKNAPSFNVQEFFNIDSSRDLECSTMENVDKTVHFILIDGTWNNSAAMVNRLKDRSKEIWGDDIHCVSLSSGESAMHRLRPQPSLDRTCTAAAGISLLSELHEIQILSKVGLDKQAEAVEEALTILLEALTARRLRMGRSTTRKARHDYNMD